MKREEIINLKQLVEKFERKLREFEKAKEKKRERLQIELLDLHKKISLNIK